MVQPGEEVAPVSSKQTSGGPHRHTWKSRGAAHGSREAAAVGYLAAGVSRSTISRGESRRGVVTRASHRGHGRDPAMVGLCKRNTQ